jgi:hypothetical protein
MKRMFHLTSRRYKKEKPVLLEVVRGKYKHCDNEVEFPFEKQSEDVGVQITERDNSKLILPVDDTFQSDDGPENQARRNLYSEAA